nr:BrxA/BrxB family bacilliredoxin [Planctomycetota bacterium]
MALKDAVKKPTQVTTVFAGVDKEATTKARGYFAEYPPSSPSAALLKDGE